MDLSSVIIGPVVTEKAERFKDKRVHVLRVLPSATKIDVKNALQRYYDVEVEAVRVLRAPPKKRSLAKGRLIQKRSPLKKAFVLLAAESKPLDLTSLKK